MKVLIIGFSKIAYMPYLNFYLEHLLNQGNEIHLMYWKRDEKPDSVAPAEIIQHKFEQNQEDSISLWKKIPNFLRYRRFATKIFKSHKFDLIIVLHTTPGVLFIDELMKNYKKKYILDYRDFTYENYEIYKRIIGKLVKHSSVTFVSSEGYKKFLPEEKHIYISHNLVKEIVENRNYNEKNSKVEPIKIRFWGFMRHTNINIDIINGLKNDKRFELHYHGREEETGRLLKAHCEKYNIINVFFHGEYKPLERMKFMENTDLVHNIYENNIKTINAMGNKFYDSISFSLPQICNEGSYMGGKVSDNKIGLTINPKSQIADKIYDYYKSIQWDELRENCNKTLTKIISEHELNEKELKKMLERKRVK